MYAVEKDMESVELRRRLKDNAEEVSRALTEFMNERAAAVSRQEQAMIAYDMEIKEIDEDPLYKEESER